MQPQYKPNSLAAGVLALLCGVTQAQEAITSAVVITGSRIPRASLEGPSPVTVLTGEDITKQGYKNVFDALTSQSQNSGFVQGADFGNTFTPSANAISLRGLGPNHTLVLLNGRRMADFPIAYEGTVNFTNLANIPSSIVERIEILNGGASSVYGSDAIAGVVNIILKKQAKGFDINAKAGTTTRGGGGDKRLQFSGGQSWDKLNTVFSVELSERDPLWSADRDFMASRTGVAPSSILSRKNVSTGKFVDPGETCASLSDLFGGSTVKYTAKAGSYCASPKVGPTYWTTQTKNSSQNLFGSANYELSDSATLFAEALYGQNRSSNNTRGPSWTSRSATDSYFYNQNTKTNEAWTRYISPEEMGGVGRYNRHWEDQVSSLSVGVRGQIPNSTWNYEAGYSASLYKSQNHTQRALANIDTFFLGPQLGVTAAGIAIFAPDPARLAKRLTPQEFNSITGAAVSDDKAWTNTLSLTANGEAFQLPAGPVKVAVVAELGKQGFANRPDERINQGYFNTVTPTEITAGLRKRYAVGAEAGIPIVKGLDATVAGRYDHYSFAGRGDGRFTYNGGLEWRPATQLLVRGNYATSFRAPDMNYIYKARGTGYYSSTTDYYRCAKAGQPLADCDYAGYSPGADYVQTGSRDLRSERGRSAGLGVVWSPSADFDATLDYWKVRIDDLVTNLSADKLLRDESDCRIKGDLTSPTCADAIRRIVRYADNALTRPGEIKTIHVNPINAASTETTGIDISAKYTLRTAAYGNFTAKVNASKTLTQESRQFVGDPLNDDKNDIGNSDWRDKVNTSLTWNVGDWSSTVLLRRYGKIPRGDGKDWLTPTTLVNASVVYKLSKATTVSVAVNNVLDRIKRDDTGGWPYYPVGSYSPAGRQVWLELNHHFGG
ncbi:TonB-dependent receptor [Pseudoduganella sp. DS3]|uniref:TonB-dependent receptor n=1 Tax=Pseudoduganella guangdongensis TaxID=2692179 RepID=A0A6N9HNA0_9BURK|nr:TonB-dependent receptor [Pseudoduganella guangdongensis]MYN04185.1 TonB-dependent receptor [Pseudoduganella guangdongensis]